MDWWSELWLNEGFATWVGWLAVDHLHPGKLTLLESKLVANILQNGTSGLSLLYVQNLEVNSSMADEET
jgi:aminopeptidase N